MVAVRGAVEATSLLDAVLWRLLDAGQHGRAVDFSRAAAGRKTSYFGRSPPSQPYRIGEREGP